ncbi:carbohydrate esterase family 4 protein [Moniliophthora roreri MCA 2997]|uniref:chitin deacetylase n=1 Tax=Moniliophthora roreri (strain MCA 2997) TaxID=1381753 RepID=V2WN16_MONRO|nr:carbohydrate esterase family 4 protein [Moniliophthora roreri MCA 2997]
MFVKQSLLTVALVALLEYANAADRSTVAEQNAILDPEEQCAPYNYPPIADQITKFPKTGEIASILPGDDAARAKFNEIVGGIPKIASKGDITKTIKTYDSGNDPDCWWTATGCTRAKAPGVPSDVEMIPAASTLGYGFDDGPFCAHNQFYDYLTSQNQKATMFFIGTNVLNFPLQAKRAAEDGHEICVHTWSHNPLTGLTNEQVFAEIWYTFVQPPQGDIDDRIRYIVDALNLKSILWKHDTDDTIPVPGTDQADPVAVDKNYEEFIQLARGGEFQNQGAILLAHETNNMTITKAIKFYPQLKASFKNVLPVAQALSLTPGNDGTANGNGTSAIANVQSRLLLKALPPLKVLLLPKALPPPGALPPLKVLLLPKALPPPGALPPLKALLPSAVPPPLRAPPLNQPKPLCRECVNSNVSADTKQQDDNGAISARVSIHVSWLAFIAVVYAL